MDDTTGDPWGDEGFGGEDDWEGKESLEADLEDGEDEGLDLSLALDDEPGEGNADADLDEAL